MLRAARNSFSPPRVRANGRQRAGVTLAWLCLLFVGAYAQEPPPPPVANPQTDDVVRINADLVQADVVVLDRAGRFVDNLTRADFVLDVDGRQFPFAFFERITTGSGDEEAQLALARGRTGDLTATAAAVQPLDRGRNCFFFVDDFHLSPAGTQQVRSLLRRFIETDLGQNDQMAIISASGVIGFLQQLTNERAVLLTAIERIKPRPPISDYQTPPLSVYQALAIEQRDVELLDFFAAQLIKRENASMQLEQARPIVVERAHALLQQAADATAKTLFGLESALKPAAALPGRKLVFFLSDGFYIDPQNSTSLGQLRRIANTAARAGAVIYALDTSGLSTDLPGVGNETFGDPSGRLLHASVGAIQAAQDPLHALAADTGGRAVFNSNSLSAGVTVALNETARYYLLVWQPDAADGQGGKFNRIAISVQGHPEYKVLVRRGYFRLDADTMPRVLSARPQPKPGRRVSPAPQTAPELISAIVAPYPVSALPTALSLSYQDVPTLGPVVSVAVLVDGAGIAFAAPTGEPGAVVEVGGIVFNQDGRQVASFKNRLNINAPADGPRPADWRGVVSQYNVQLTPGLYQFRVAARDLRTGQTGSAMQWIAVPDLAARRLTLASLQLGEVVSGGAGGPDKAQTHIRPNIGGRFAAESHLRFRTYVYNATRGSEQLPDVVLQVQIFRDNQPVVTAPLRPLPTRGAADLARLLYEAELPLTTLPTGRYQLRVTAVDRVAKMTTTQQASFAVR